MAKHVAQSILNSTLLECKCLVRLGCNHCRVKKCQQYAVCTNCGRPGVDCHSCQPYNYRCSRPVYVYSTGFRWFHLAMVGNSLVGNTFDCTVSTVSSLLGFWSACLVCRFLLIEKFCYKKKIARCNWTKLNYSLKTHVDSWNFPGSSLRASYLDFDRGHSFPSKPVGYSM